MSQKNPCFFFLLVAILLLLPGSTRAQDTTDLDSLYNRAQMSSPREMVAVFDALQERYLALDQEQAIHFARQGLKQTEKGSPLSRVLANRNMAFVYGKFGFKEEALRHFQRALATAKENQGEEMGLGLAYFHLGQFLSQQGLLSEGLQHILDASKIFESLQLYNYVTLCHYESCMISYSARNYQQCIDEGYRLLQYHDRVGETESSRADYFQKMSTCNTIALAHRQMRQYAAALRYYDQAEALARKINDEFWIGLINGNKAVVLRDMGRTEEAKAGVLADYRVSQKFSMWSSAGMAALTMSDIYLTQGNYPLANAYLDSAHLMFSRQHDVVESRKNMASYWLAWSRLKSVEGAYGPAYDGLLKHVKLRDSLSHEQEALNLAKVNVAFDLDRKQTEIALLTKNNEIQEERIRSQNILFIVTLMGLILLVVLVILLVNNFRRQRNISRLIRQQRDEIEIKNSELEAQSAMLQENNQYIQTLNTQLEMKVVERTRQLALSNQELDTFLYRSSHDIRRPITTLLGLDQVARHIVNDPQANMLFDKVVETARNMDSMLFKMQMMYELNKPDLPLEPIHLNPLVEEAVQYFQNDFRRFGITNHLSVHADITILSNVGLLRIIFRNLIENAVLFRKTQPGVTPFIDVNIMQIGDHVEIHVADNGMGVEEKYQARLFDLYFRASQASKGNGLGLYLVNKAIHKLKGTITLISDYGIGTTFTIHLPLAQPNSAN
ncbi:tetratricopeptide repeat-containing sensor histidine kinase [Parachryseolinea silvisoli]|uniref:tetratricopeptide repeat-containing sensor histidine kinase n=1 Tax=Parachryseolinea silvisoli TaxID=2873601 RepID=UPI002265C63B|nr:tetratricopeptide repeat-containing sensor histidine kinase [Parachryseolinea silvisoli]MCD9019552.1 tetratricopeptide repeat-containing sensor histidine kinase [Parachryseolinea silvisoli]